MFFFLLLRDGKANSLVIPRMYKPFLSKSKLILCSDIFFEIRSSVIANEIIILWIIFLPPSFKYYYE